MTSHERPAVVVFEIEQVTVAANCLKKHARVVWMMLTTMAL